MRFKIDENLPSDLGGLLALAGHDAHSVLDENLSGAADSTAKVCQEEDRILVTLDLDFANIRNYPPHEYPGIIVLRLSRQDRTAVFSIIPRILELLRTEPVSQRLWIVEDQHTRIRE